MFDAKRLTEVRVDRAGGIARHIMQPFRHRRYCGLILRRKQRYVAEVVSYDLLAVGDLRFSKYRRCVPYCSIQFINAEIARPSIAITFHRIAANVAAVGLTCARLVARENEIHRQVANDWAKVARVQCTRRSITNKAGRRYLR
jgi:hypothetical protein